MEHTTTHQPIRARLVAAVAGIALLAGFGLSLLAVETGSHGATGSHGVAIAKTGTRWRQ